MPYRVHEPEQHKSLPSRRVKYVVCRARALTRTVRERRGDDQWCGRSVFGSRVYVGGE